MYDPSKIEPKWQQYWLENKTFKSEVDANKEKYYVLDMFPYPSGAGLHVGHPEGYTGTDIISRYKRMKGFNVLHPMGWDAFGLPAENYAIKTGVHPDKSTNDNIQNFRRQIQSIGFSYDWDREINTSSPEYYRWTQWFFLFLYKNGLAYKKEAPVNWCESCKTVLANEQVNDGKCERSKDPVVKKELSQWFFKITDFIEDVEKDGRTTDGLLSGLKKIDWPNSTLTNQYNWIGKSEGLVFTAPVKDMDLDIQTFSAHFEACYADTFVVIAPDHPLLETLLEGIQNKQEILDFCRTILDKRMKRGFEEEKESEGIFTGRYIKDPLGNGDLPIWVASYALADYGTGIVKCSAHDERDFKFAKKYGIHMKPVLFPQDDPELEQQIRNFEVCYTDTQKGILKEPQEFHGRVASDVRKEVIQHCEKKGFAKRKASYRLRDWLISRQRYWGAPIPLVYDDQDKAYPLPDDELPVVLPTDVDFVPTGTSPLLDSKTFHHADELKRIEEKLKASGQLGPDRTIVKRESDTMDTFVCSSWYLYRYADPHNNQVFADKKLMNQWCPVDLYVGGAEHTVLHLLYARFICKALHQHGYIDFDEPFQKLRHQGLIMGEDGEKMSKSLGNVINPDDVITRYGADTLRVYEMFMGPFEDSKPWSTKSIEGAYRFLQKVYRLVEEGNVVDETPSESLNKTLHKTIKKVTEDIENFSFNTAISAMMILANEVMKEKAIPKSVMEPFALILSPFAPHLAEELWEKLGHSQTLAYEPWPTYDESLTVDNTFELVFSVNGKVRGKKEVEKSIGKEDAIKLAHEDENVQRNIDGKDIVKEIYVPGKLVNIVVK